MSYFSRLNTLQRIEHLRHEGPQDIHVVASHRHNQDRDRKRRQVLLELQIPVGCQKDIEVDRSLTQQIAT